MVIVEGMDNTGKSTLVSMLGKTFHLTQVRHSPKLPWERRELLAYLPALAQFDQLLKRRVIVDRWPPISESVYGSVLRKADRLRSYYRGGSLVIWCNPPRDTVLDFGDRPQMDGVTGMANRLMAAYREEMEYVALHYPVVPYDYTAPGSYDVVSLAVQSYLEKT
jgi:hypothetical protein